MAPAIRTNGLPGIIDLSFGRPLGQRPLAIIEHQTYFFDLGPECAVLELEQGDDRPVIIADQPQDFDDWRIAFAKRGAAAVVFSSVAEMHARYALVVSLEEAYAIAVGGSKVARVESGFEIGRESEPLFKTSLRVEGIRIREVVVIVEPHKETVLRGKWNEA